MLWLTSKFLFASVTIFELAIMFVTCLPDLLQAEGKTRFDENLTGFSEELLYSQNYPPHWQGPMLHLQEANWKRRGSNYLHVSLPFFSPTGRKAEYSDWSNGNSTDQGRRVLWTDACSFSSKCVSLYIWHAYNNVEVLPVFTSKPEFPSSLKDLLSRFGPMATRIHFPCVPADGSHTVFSWDPLSTREPVLAHQLPPPLHLHRQLYLLLEHIVVRLHPSLLTLPPSTQASLGTRRE